MKKEVLVYFYVGILILGAIFIVYLFNLRFTGFAVVTPAEGSEFSFPPNVSSQYVIKVNNTDVGQNSNIIQVKITLPSGFTFIEGSNNTDASYENFTNTSSILSWTNLTGYLINGSESKIFQFNASASNSGDYNLTINVTNVTDSFAYNISVKIVAPVPVTTITLFEPLDSGTITSRTGIPIKFTFTGDNLQCWYNVKPLAGEDVTANTTPSACANSTFSVGGDGDYVLTLYANGSSGFTSQSSSFLVSTPPKNKTEPKDIPLIPEENKTTLPEPQVQSVTDLSLQGIETFSLNPSYSKDLNLVVKNTGTEPVSGCKLSASGDYASWLSIPDDSKNFNSGDEKSFSFSINVPENTTEANYAFPITMQCAEVSKNSEFTVQVIKKRFEFNLTEVQRTRGDRVRVTYSLEELLNEEQTLNMKFSLFDAANQQVANVSQNQTLSAGESDEFRTNIPINESLEGNLTLTIDLNSEKYSSSVRELITLGAPVGGFVIFGEGGLGTGGVAVVLIVFVSLVVIFFVVRKMKSSGKTLRNLLGGTKKD